MKVFDNPYKLKLISIDDGSEFFLVDFCSKYLEVFYTDLLLVFEYENYYYILDECGSYDVIPCDKYKLKQIK